MRNGYDKNQASSVREEAEGGWHQLATTQRGLSLHVEIEANLETGLDGTSYVQCELVRSISRNRLIHRLGAIDSDASNRVATIVRTLLDY